MNGGTVKQILNTLYVTLPAYIRTDHDTLRVEVDRKLKLQVPVHHLGSIVCFGDVLVSPATIHRCAADGRALIFLSQTGRFKARVVGPTSGNVLLRQAQHQAVGDQETALSIARNIVAGKLQNARNVIMRAARETTSQENGIALRKAAKTTADVLMQLPTCADLPRLRGLEGGAANAYFGVFDRMINDSVEDLNFDGRNRRPPRDPVNALLSFLYSLVLSDCVSALEGVGLDPQVGFLHVLRPGRPALALDLMEEFRPLLSDRLVLTLINRRQITYSDFKKRPGGAVEMDDEARKTVLEAYQKKKQEDVNHPVLDQKIPMGLIPHVQARFLSRFLREEMEAYLPFVPRQ